MNKLCYTCITGNYDTLKEPLVVSDGWDYICFTDEDIEYNGSTWKIVKIGKTKDKCRHQRKKKIYNEWVFDNYDVSLWVDGSIQIACDLNQMYEHCKGYNITLMKHPTRDCIYREAEVCISINKDKESIITKQVQGYRKEGLPENAGMVATGIILRKHTKEVRKFCSMWWDEVKDKSIRDQLSFNYINWKKPIKHGLLPFGILYKEFRICRHAR